MIAGRHITRYSITSQDFYKIPIIASNLLNFICVFGSSEIYPLNLGLIIYLKTFAYLQNYFLEIFLTQN